MRTSGLLVEELDSVVCFLIGDLLELVDRTRVDSQLLMHIMLEYVSTIDVAGMHFRARWQLLGRSSVGWCTPLMKLMWLRECVMRSPRISLNPQKVLLCGTVGKKGLRALTDEAGQPAGSGNG